MDTMASYNILDPMGQELEYNSAGCHTVDIWNISINL